jgi:hypothetical protein
MYYDSTGMFIVEVILVVALFWFIFKLNKSAPVKKQGKPSPFMPEFMPDAELVAFAEKIAADYRKMPPGEYKSDAGTYVLESIPDCLLFDPGSSAFSVKVTEQKPYGMRVDQKKILSGPHSDLYNSDTIFYFIIWCGCYGRLRASFPTRAATVLAADDVTVKYYLTTSRPNKAIASIIEILSLAPSNINMKRAENIIKMLATHGDVTIK